MKATLDEVEYEIEINWVQCIAEQDNDMLVFMKVFFNMPPAKERTEEALEKVIDEEVEKVYKEGAGYASQKINRGITQADANIEEEKQWMAGQRSSEPSTSKPQSHSEEEIGC